MISFARHKPVDSGDVVRPALQPNSQMTVGVLAALNEISYYQYHSPRASIKQTVHMRPSPATTFCRLGTPIIMMRTLSCARDGPGLCVCAPTPTSVRRVEDREIATVNIVYETNQIR